MTHDELLEQLKQTLIQEEMEQSVNFDDYSINQHAWKALIAVVELHKPKEEDGKLWCEYEVCYNHIEFLERDDCYCFYPCPTIRAITKELS